MENEEEKVGISAHGEPQKKSTQQSALITDPANRPVLVAKLRDDLNVLIKAGFLVAIKETPLKIGNTSVQSLSITIATKPPSEIGFSSGSFYLDNEKIE